MKIQAYVPVFNEADILPHTIRHLHEQGCDVHVIDGWSTDGSAKLARAAGATVERFPASRPDAIQNCTAILVRIEELAQDSDADWILYSDADEWRRSGIPGETLAQMCERAEEQQINAIDFRVFQFYCVSFDHGYSVVSEKESPEDWFHYYNETDCISRLPNRKLWENVGRVTLAGGGHLATFPGMVCCRMGVMKHYPFRTPEQARRKIETRLARRRMEEHAKGWGVHYDQYPADFSYCWDPAKLKFWQDTRSPLP